jgi:catechol 2,3-dioxygenase-like lactoylglutathione lyase family enzyme
MGGITVERVDFISICVQEIERARSFYLETLGLPLDCEVPTGGFEVTCGQVTLGVWEPEKLGLPFAPNPNDIALRVADVHKTRKELEARGVEFAGETLDTGVCHMAFFHDPDGNALMLHRRYAPHAS